MTISFERLQEEHLLLLTRWLQAPHVRAFWDDGERTQEAVRATSFQEGEDEPGFVFRVEGRAAGLLQREQISEENAFWPWAAPDGETWGVDLLIGEADLLGQGLGPAVMGALLDALRAVRAYARVGFVPLTPLETTWGQVLLMGLDVP